MKVRFWGTRGSVAKPGPSTLRYGGNTSCVEVRADDGTLIVLDCGTGAHGLGQALMAGTDGPVRGHLLIGHTHWDHIQGLPFFAPLFTPGNEWDIYAPHGLSQSLRETLAGQMQYTYFPVTLEALGATIRYHDLVEGEFQAGSVRVRARYLNHPALTLGYRLEADGASVVYACDHEPASRQPASGEPEIGAQDSRHVAFLREADLVIHDTQYVAREYANRIGWGHSTVEYAQAVCRAAGARILALTHHDPLRDDDAIDRIVAELDAARDPDDRLQVLAAAEGGEIEVRGAADQRLAAPEFPATTPVTPAMAEHRLLLGPTDARSEATIRAAATDEGVRIDVVTTADQVAPAFAASQPSLVILDARSDTGHEAGAVAAICQAVRRLGQATPPQAPITIIADRQDAAGDLAGFATDWLIVPFSREYVRTRLRGWMLRMACRWIRAGTPEDEEERLAALHRLDILDTAPEPRFDLLARIAADTFQVPIALVSLVDRDRQWFKSNIGLENRETHRDASFCAHAILRDEVMVVPDTLVDERFADNPLVTGAPRIRFYAGCPLRLPDGHRVGTLCLIDSRPRQLDEAQSDLLRNLARLVERELTDGASTPPGA